MTEPYLGQIIMFGGNFAIRGYAFCDGQLLSIAQNSALFAILGTTYGGNGQTTFGLPDFRGRVPVHMGHGNGLSPYSLGQMGGVEGVTLGAAQIPAHNHPLMANSNAADQLAPNNHILAAEPTGMSAIYTDQPANTQLNPQAIGATGGSQPHENRQPYLTVTFQIALQGVFPSRS